MKPRIAMSLRQFGGVSLCTCTIPQQRLHIAQLPNNIPGHWPHPRAPATEPSGGIASISMIFASGLNINGSSNCIAGSAAHCNSIVFAHRGIHASSNNCSCSNFACNGANGSFSFILIAAPIVFSPSVPSAEPGAAPSVSLTALPSAAPALSPTAMPAGVSPMDSS